MHTHIKAFDDFCDLDLNDRSQCERSLSPKIKIANFTYSVISLVEVVGFKMITLHVFCMVKSCLRREGV